jgi:hypothetical protein
VEGRSLESQRVDRLLLIFVQNRQDEVCGCAGVRVRSVRWEVGGETRVRRDGEHSKQEVDTIERRLTSRHMQLLTKMSSTNEHRELYCCAALRLC